MPLMDRLLSNMSVDVEPFALCRVSTGWRLTLPPPPHPMLHFVLEGSGLVRSGPDVVLPIYPYSLAVVPGSHPHALESGQEATSEEVITSLPTIDGAHELTAGQGDRPSLRVACGLIEARYGEALALFEGLPGLIVVDLSPFPQVRAAFEGILAEQGSPGDGSTTLMQALMSQCLVYFLRGLADQSDVPLPWLTALDDPDLGRALDAMLDDPAGSHTVESLANTALMSRSTFAKRFHEAFGSTPLGFLHELRMRRAATLLQRSRHVPVERVAREVGFASRSRFSDAFKSRFGMTPAVFRATSN